MAGITETPARPNTKQERPGIYEARLFNADGTVDISTPLPERFPLGLATSWDTPFNQPLSETFGGANAGQIENVVRGTFGQTSLHKWMSGAVWTSGSVLEISEIPFVLQAKTNAKVDVLDQYIKLLNLVAPSETASGLLQAPGPHLLGEEVIDSIGGDVVTLQIGNFFTMTPCIVESVQGDFDTQFDHSGYPISGIVSVTVKSFWSVTRQDIAKMFNSI